MVKRIVAARETAPFQSLDDLDTRVRGIGPATLAALSPFLQFEPAETMASSDLTDEQRSSIPTSAARAVHLARRP
jgi:hypothetical protein